MPAMATDTKTGEDYYKEFVAYHLTDSTRIANTVSFALAPAEALEKSCYVKEYDVRRRRMLKQLIDQMVMVRISRTGVS